MNLLESFAARHGVPAEQIFHPITYGETAQAGRLQNELSWYTKGWDAYMLDSRSARSEDQAYAMAHDIAGSWNRQEVINGFVDAWRSTQPQPSEEPSALDA